MTDIYTSVARSAWRSGRTIRMTQKIASDETWLNYLTGVRATTARQLEQYLAHAQALTSNLARLDTLIEREKTNPTQAPDWVDASPDAAADGGQTNGAESNAVDPAAPRPAAAPSTVATVLDPPSGPGTLMSGAYARVPGPEPSEDDAPTAHLPAQDGRTASDNGASPWQS